MINSELKFYDYQNYCQTIIDNFNITLGKELKLLMVEFKIFNDSKIKKIITDGGVILNGKIYRRLKKIGGRYTKKTVFINLSKSKNQNFIGTKRTEKKFNLENVVFVLYHEISHSTQMDGTSSPTIQLFDRMEGFIMKAIPQDYKNNHNDYCIEIDANLNASIQSINHWLEKRNYEVISELEKVKCFYEFKRTNFDFDRLLNLFFDFICKKHPTSFIDDKFINDFFVYDKEYHYKELSDIIESNSYKMLEETEVIDILITNKFINELKFELLSSKEQALIERLVRKAIEKYQNSISLIIYYDSYSKRLKKQINKTITRTKGKIKFLENYYDEVINNFYNNKSR